MVEELNEGQAWTSMNTIIVPVKGLNFAGCAREIEKHLSKIEAIGWVEASYVSQMVTITYNPTLLSKEQVRALVTNCGFACGEPLLTTRTAQKGSCILLVFCSAQRWQYWL